MRNCTICKLEKDESEFSKDSSRKDGLQAKCKSCQKVLSAKHYRQNKKTYDDRRDERVRVLKIEIRQMKECNPCTDCKKFYPFYVMHWDHISDNKIRNVSKMLRRKESRKAVLAEIAKCELVCSNCHAERTYDRLRQTGKAASLV